MKNSIKALVLLCVLTFAGLTIEREGLGWAEAFQAAVRTNTTTGVIYIKSVMGILPTQGISGVQGTITTDLQAISTTATWNNAGVTFTHWKANVTDTASNAASLLLDLQIGGVSKFKVDKLGGVTAASNINTAGSYNVGTCGATNEYRFLSGTLVGCPSDGVVAVTNNARSIGVRLKADALPTVASGFGTSPAITAGSTPMAGSINVGTGGTATTGVINFNGTAFATAPFCVVSDQTSNVTTRSTASTTQLTLNTTVAWTASDIVSWICISAK